MFLFSVRWFVAFVAILGFVVGRGQAEEIADLLEEGFSALAGIVALRQQIFVGATFGFFQVSYFLCGIFQQVLLDS